MHDSYVAIAICMYNNRSLLYVVYIASGLVYMFLSHVRIATHAYKASLAMHEFPTV